MRENTELQFSEFDVCSLNLWEMLSDIIRTVSSAAFWKKKNFHSDPTMKSVSNQNQIINWNI